MREHKGNVKHAKGNKKRNAYNGKGDKENMNLNSPIQT